MCVGVQHVGGVTLERRPPSQHLVGHHPQGIHIRGRPHGPSSHLLGRHVGRRAQHCPRASQPGARQCLGHPKVRQGGMILWADQNVPRLDVAVDQAPGMGVVQGLGDLVQNAYSPLHRQRPFPADDLGQGVPLQVLHGNEVVALQLTDVIDGDDVGVFETSSSPGFLEEALDKLLVPSEVRGQYLDGHQAVQYSVVGFEDHAHAAAADLF